MPKTHSAVMISSVLVTRIAIKGVSSGQSDHEFHLPLNHLGLEGSSKGEKALWLPDEGEARCHPGFSTGMAITKGHFVSPNQVEQAATIFILKDAFVTIRMDGANHGFPELVGLVGDVTHQVGPLLPFDDILKFLMDKADGRNRPWLMVSAAAHDHG